jgi:aminoglycoside phosphotransferase (APT) family kinase protein
MEKVVATILPKLQAQGIKLEAGSITKHHTQGFISTVYTADSDQGKLIVQVVYPIREQVRLRMWEKFHGISNLVKKNPDIPAAEVLLVERLGDSYVLVQKMLPGKSAGRRTIDGSRVADEWFVDLAQYAPQIENILAAIHQIPIKGYGWLVPDGEGVRGMYDSWLEFFEKEGRLWLNGIGEAEQKLKKDDLIKRVENFYKNLTHHVVYTGPSQLTHGDLINPSNILVEKDRVTGIVDWEWSIAGDPALDFAHLNKYPLTTYFKVLRYNEKQSEDFRGRIKTYEPLWLMCHGYLHSWNPDGALYQTVRHLLLETLRHHERD